MILEPVIQAAIRTSFAAKRRKKVPNMDHHPFAILELQRFRIECKFGKRGNPRAHLTFAGKECDRTGVLMKPPVRAEQPAPGSALRES